MLSRTPVPVRKTGREHFNYSVSTLAGIPFPYTEDSAELDRSLAGSTSPVSILVAGCKLSHPLQRTSLLPVRVFSS